MQNQIVIKSTDVMGAVEACPLCGRFVVAGNPVWAFQGDSPVCPDCIFENDTALAEILEQAEIQGGHLYEDEQESSL